MTARGAFRFGDISKIELVLVILLLLFTSALYSPSLSSGFYMDDWEELEHARDFEWHSWMASFSPFSGLWRPMFYLFWALIFKIAPANPVPYHVAHLGLHLFSNRCLGAGTHASQQPVCSPGRGLSLRDPQGQRWRCHVEQRHHRYAGSSVRDPRLLLLPVLSRHCAEETMAAFTFLRFILPRSEIEVDGNYFANPPRAL